MSHLRSSGEEGLVPLSGMQEHAELLIGNIEPHNRRTGIAGFIAAARQYRGVVPMKTPGLVGRGFKISVEVRFD